MGKYGAVEIEGDPKNPKIVSELIDESIFNKHLNKDEAFTFKHLYIKDDKGDKYKLEVKDSKLSIKKKEV